MALEPITRQEKIIAGQDLTPITRMEKFLKNFGGGGGGSVPKPLTYDYMPEGYPYKEQSETVFLDWDGNIGDKENVNFSDLSGGESYYVKVGDTIPQKEDFVGAAIQNNFGEVSTVSSEMLVDLTGGYVVGSEMIVVVSNKDTFDLNGVKLPSNGLWVSKFMDESGVWNYYQSIIRTSETIHKMATEFIPNIAEIDSIIMKSSTTDSTKKFKITVDDSGAISATEVT